MKICLKKHNDCEYVDVKEGMLFDELAKQYQKESGKKVYAVKFNNNIKELFKSITEEGTVEFITLDSMDGVRIYQRGIIFLLDFALSKVNPEDKLYVHSMIGNGLYCELKSGIPTESYLKEISDKMLELVKQDIKLEKTSIDKFKAIKMFEEKDYESKALLLKYRKKQTVNIYKINDYFNYFYGYMPESTGMLELFEIKKQSDGFVIVHPTQESPDKVPEYKHFEKLSQSFREYNQWLRIMEIKNVGELNEFIARGKESTSELIRITDALHTKRYANIADEIVKKEKVRMVCIAGPSSSGKTTSAKRLALHLRVNGKKVVPISLDDYFVQREKTPRDEFGEYDFESIHALDLDLLNKTLLNLFDGQEVEIPRFNFVTGSREWHGNKLKLEKDQILIIEGIHGLNEQLTESIPRELKYKMYVSALTQMNLDDLNRIPTTDTRLIRRIVRDFNYRGHDALATFKMWPSVRRGEERNIFPYQEEADVMFNSYMAYELAVLKIFAEPLLLKIDNTVPQYSEAKRLLRFLDYFLPITELEEISKKSIIREFIGRSTFEY